MIAVHDEENLFPERVVGERLGQFTEKLVHLGKLIDVVNESVERIGPDRIGLRRNARVFRRDILTVSLHRDRQNQVAPLRRSHRVKNLSRQNLVFRPAERVIFESVHILDRGETVKTERGVGDVAGVEGGGIIVDGVRLVAEFAEQIRDRFAALALQKRLVGILARSEIVVTHPGHKLELGVRRSGSDRRNRQKSGRIRVFQFGKIRDRVLGEGDVGKPSDVEKRLELKDDDVRSGISLFGSLAVYSRCQFVDSVSRIPVGTVHAAVEDTAGKTVRETVAVVRFGQVGKGVGVIPEQIQGNDQSESDQGGNTDPDKSALEHYFLRADLDRKDDHPGDRRENGKRD